MRLVLVAAMLCISTSVYAQQSAEVFYRQLNAMQSQVNSVQAQEMMRLGTENERLKQIEQQFLALKKKEDDAKKELNNK